MSLYPPGTAHRLIETAIGEIGYVEKPVNRTKYGEFTGADSLPWCGSFVNWCAHEAGVKLPSMVSTAMGAERLKDVGRWHSKPERGDLAFFDFPGDGIDRISHIGIVVQVNADSVLTVEGNTAPSGGDQRNGGQVMLKHRQFGAGTSIVGFGRPKFKPFPGDFPEIKAGEEAVKPKKKRRKKDGSSKSASSELGSELPSRIAGGLSSRSE
jgi:hypothetical protein